jgi:transposase-like protein
MYSGRGRIGFVSPSAGGLVYSARARSTASLRGVMYVELTCWEPLSSSLFRGPPPGSERARRSRSGCSLGKANEHRAVYTDDWPPYRGIGDHNTRHEAVNHSAKEWVRADVHTNTVEGVWSLFKRSIVGSYHQLSVKHLPAYLDEMEFRFSPDRASTGSDVSV